MTFYFPFAGRKTKDECNILTSLVPFSITKVIEPFGGTGSVARALLNSKRHNIKKFIIGDLDSDLIRGYHHIHNNGFDSETMSLWGNSKWKTAKDKPNITKDLCSPLFHFVAGDFRDTIKDNVEPNTLIFLDPPYIFARSARVFVDDDIAKMFIDVIDIAMNPPKGTTVMLTVEDNAVTRRLFEKEDENFIVSVLNKDYSRRACYNKPASKILITKKTNL